MIERIIFLLKHLKHLENNRKLFHENAKVAAFFNEKTTQTPAYKEIKKKINQLKISLLNEKTEIENINLGAGKNRKKHISISEIAKQASSSDKDRELLFKLAKNSQLQSIIELGTSLGLSTATLALANSQSQVYTIEGNPFIAKKAKENFRFLKLQNIEVYSGAFDEILPELLLKVKSPFLAFIDGNHSYEASLRYFKLFSSVATQNCILIFHDINWSRGMRQAWDEIRKATDSKVFVEYWNAGLVFFI